MNEVNDSGLTEIKGIGSETAPDIQETTNATTPAELAEMYLTETDGTAREAISRTEAFNEWLIANYDQLSLDISHEKLKLYLFVVEHGCNVEVSDIDGENISSRHSTVDKDGFSVNDINMIPDGLWVDSANVFGIANGMEALSDSYPWCAETKEIDRHESDGEDFTQFFVDGEETLILDEFLDTIHFLFRTTNSDVMAHPDGESPIVIHDTETDLVGVVAPRIRT